MMTTTHSLKIWPQWFKDVKSGVKTFEIRRDDRGFKVGDLLKLEEFRAGGGEYTGRAVMRRIIYISSRQAMNVDAEALGLRDGFCVLGLEAVEQQE